MSIRLEPVPILLRNLVVTAKRITVKRGSSYCARDRLRHREDGPPKRGGQPETILRLSGTRLAWTTRFDLPT